MANGVLIASSSTGSGKTFLTLGILRAVRDLGHKVKAAKAGPDFIDISYHKVASGGDCFNLDPWGMSKQRLLQFGNFDNFNRSDDSFLIIEAMMGLYDGALDGSGTAADLAKLLGLPIILVLDCQGQSHSIGALVRGFLSHDESLNFAGVILNKVGSSRHVDILTRAIEPFGIKILGAIPRQNEVLPSRHLGLVMANEVSELETYIENAAKLIKTNIDLEYILSLQLNKLDNDVSSVTSSKALTFPAMGKHIAIACDVAFCFIYSHILQDWRNQGCKLSFFSPVGDEAIPENCDVVYLPGGYPELHCKRLAQNKNFLTSLQRAKAKGKIIYGECGGYMLLGKGIIDKDGTFYEMANLLPITTSFAKRGLSLGYRYAELLHDCALGMKNDKFTCHEFHYSTVAEIDKSISPLFVAKNACGELVGEYGMKRENVMGSYLHLLDCLP